MLNQTPNFPGKLNYPHLPSPLKQKKNHKKWSAAERWNLRSSLFPLADFPTYPFFLSRCESVFMFVRIWVYTCVKLECRGS